MAHRRAAPFTFRIVVAHVSAARARQVQTIWAMAPDCKNTIMRFARGSLSLVLVSRQAASIACRASAKCSLDIRLSSWVTCTQVILPQPAPGPATEALKRIATRMKTTNLIVCRTVNDAFKAAFGSKAQKGKKKPGPARDDVDLSDE